MMQGRIESFADFPAAVEHRDEPPAAQRRELDRALQAGFQEYRQAEMAATIRRAERRGASPA